MYVPRSHCSRERDPMVRMVLLTLLCSFVFTHPAHAKPRITCEVKVVARHKLLVTFAWKANITSDKVWQACDLSISFQDAKGKELYVVRKRLNLKVGKNVFEDEGICDRAVWQRIRKYVTTLDCIF